MHQPLETVLKQLPSRADISDAIVEQSGGMGKALHCAPADERGERDAIQGVEISGDERREISLRALAWSREFSETLHYIRAA